MENREDYSIPEINPKEIEEREEIKSKKKVLAVEIGIGGGIALISLAGYGLFANYMIANQNVMTHLIDSYPILACGGGLGMSVCYLLYTLEQFSKYAKTIKKQNQAIREKIIQHYEQAELENLDNIDFLKNQSLLYYDVAKSNYFSDLKEKIINKLQNNGPKLTLNNNSKNK